MDQFFKYRKISEQEIAQIPKTELVVAGIRLNVFGLEQWKANSEKPRISVLFVLHGRLGDASLLDSLCYRLALLNKEATKEKSPRNHLIIISFDQVNHGTRLANMDANFTWTEGNTTHAMDMWSAQYGTARDVSSLIDVLPGYLFPDEDVSIVTKWSVCGISLGGHSAFSVLAADPRVTVGIPIIGCASYTTLITDRAKVSGIPLAPPYFSSYFLSTLAKLDAAAQPASRFRGKRILVLSGGSDELVPAAHNEPFLEGLRKEGLAEDALRVRVFDGVVHEVVEEMVEETERWVKLWLIKKEDAKL